jgi:hypothetical protein
MDEVIPEHGYCDTTSRDGHACQRGKGHPGEHGHFSRGERSPFKWSDETPDVEVTVTMRVPMSESTYRKLKAAASLRGVGQGQLAAQIIEEQLGGYMNFGPGGESFPFGRNQMPGSDVSPA